MAKPKILLHDCETLPNISYCWDLYSYKNPQMLIKEKALVCYGFKWLGDKKTTVLTTKKAYEDKEIVKQAVDMINQADYVVGHFADKFDMRFIRARALHHGLKPPAYVEQIDTYKLAKKYFNLNSNKLDFLGKFLGVGRKISTSWGLWEGCIANDGASLKKMAKYNAQDVDLLEKVFVKLLGHCDTKLNYKLFSDKKEVVCKHCGSTHLQKRGQYSTKAIKRQRYACMDCGNWTSGVI